MELLSFGFGKVLSATAGGALISRIAKRAIDAEHRRYTEEPNSAAQTRLAHYEARFGNQVESGPSENEVRAARTQYGSVLMSAFDAALAAAQLPRLPTVVRRQSAIGSRLAGIIQRHSAVFSTQSVKDNIFTRLPVILRDVDVFNQFWTYMDVGRKIGLEGMYVPLHQKFSESHSGGALPVVEDVFSRVFNVPARPSLGAIELARIESALDGFGQAMR